MAASHPRADGPSNQRGFKRKSFLESGSYNQVAWDVRLLLCRCM
jgi:hypothetical protein